MDEQMKQGMNMMNIDDLEGVTGGDGNNPADADGIPQKRMFCSDPRCNTYRLFYLGSGGRAVCSFCHTQIMY